MSGQSYIGLTFYIAAALPATNNAAGFEALTWTKVEHPISGPSLGFTHSMIDIPDLETGLTTAVKGMGAGQDSSMAFKIVGGVLATGQIIVKAQADDPQGAVSVKIGRGSGTANALVAGDPVTYAQGVMHSFVENEANETGFEGFTVGFRQNAPSVKDDQPV